MKGIRIKNPDGYVQIDSRYQNTALVSKGSLSGMGYIDIPVPSGCVVAVRPDIPALCVPYQSSGGYTLRVRVGPDRYSGNVTINVDYYTFGPPSTATPTGSTGVRIRAENGSVSYDSRLKYMKVFKVEPSSNNYPSKENQTDVNETGSTGSIVRGRLLSNRFRQVEGGGVKLAALVTTPRFVQTSTWPFGPPDGRVQDYTVEINAECVMQQGNSIRLYDIVYANNRFGVPVSEVAPEDIGRNGSGTIMIDVTGM